MTDATIDNPEHTATTPIDASDLVASTQTYWEWVSGLPVRLVKTGAFCLAHGSKGIPAVFGAVFEWIWRNDTHRALKGQAKDYRVALKACDLEAEPERHEKLSRKWAEANDEVKHSSMMRILRFVGTVAAAMMFTVGMLGEHRTGNAWPIRLAIVGVLATVLYAGWRRLDAKKKAELLPARDKGWEATGAHIELSVLVAAARKTYAIPDTAKDVVVATGPTPESKGVRYTLAIRDGRHNAATLIRGGDNLVGLIGWRKPLVRIIADPEDVAKVHIWHLYQTEEERQANAIPENGIADLVEEADGENDYFDGPIIGSHANDDGVATPTHVFLHGQHCLVMGASGTGKSTGIISMLLTAMLDRRVRTIAVVLKSRSSADFEPLAGRLNTLLVGRPGEDPGVAEALYWILCNIHELASGERSEWLIESGLGRQVGAITASSKEWGNRLHPIMLVIEEFHEIYEGDPILAQKIIAKISQISQGDRQFGVQLVLTTQKVSAELLPEKARANFRSLAIFETASTPTADAWARFIGVTGRDILRLGAFRAFVKSQRPDGKSPLLTTHINDITPEQVNELLEQVDENRAQGIEEGHAPLAGLGGVPLPSATTHADPEVRNGLIDFEDYLASVGDWRQVSETPETDVPDISPVPPSPVPVETPVSAQPVVSPSQPVEDEFDEELSVLGALVEALESRDDFPVKMTWADLADLLHAVEPEFAHVDKGRVSEILRDRFNLERCPAPYLDNSRKQAQGTNTAAIIAAWDHVTGGLR